MNPLEEEEVLATLCDVVQCICSSWSKNVEDLSLECEQFKLNSISILQKLQFLIFQFGFTLAANISIVVLIVPIIASNKKTL